ncbi:ArsR/SmtB family transcription factor [Streptomyces candidus]|uniref:DNA-binding transcriptional ArsR family regulator n=1 Tax=Streptomyces candidus TaxID=67283 RepID=A0A7X0LU71_9ACTN|nr:winged helix-turn-helix domain-containing protein [Streptomyces candidus]MBB6440144.1 DNA-binding transcriptional ArsR family regulator [Streptomyces candidus]GHH57595.1 ArsR family transcriptional regulator [Streptomyces candidus]
MAIRRRDAAEVRASALASGVRLRIIRLTRLAAMTNKELAQRLGRDPATTLHHVRKLVEAGFLEPQPARRGNRGAKEIPYLSTGLPWTLSPRNQSALAEAMLEAFLSEVGELDLQDVVQARFVLNLTRERREEYERRLEELLEEFNHDAVTPDTERTAVYLASYPSL